MNPWDWSSGITQGAADPYWADWINRGIDVVGANLGRGRYYSPDDPRFRQYPGGGMVVSGPGGPAFVPGTVGASGFSVNWWAAVLVGVVAGAFLLGQRRGR